MIEGYKDIVKFVVGELKYSAAESTVRSWKNAIGMPVHRSRRGVYVIESEFRSWFEQAVRRHPA